MNCVAHQSLGLWRQPADQSWRYKDITYRTELAKLLERGRFDGLFIADVLGTYAVCGASDEAAIRQAAQIPVGDPMLLVSAMALVTENLGFGITTGTGFQHPYPFATKAILRNTVSTIRAELELAGRNPYAAKIFNLTTIITGETDEEARAKHAEPVRRPRRSGVGGT